MRERASWLAAWAASMAGSLAAQPTVVTPALTEAERAKLHARLVPAAGAPWQRIRWSVDLLAARRRAIREKKPLFMWAMNGHPLGCT